MDKDVHALESIKCFPDDFIRAVGDGDICLNKMRAIGFHGFRAGRHNDGSFALQKTLRNRLARALRATGHQNTFAPELLLGGGKRITIGHQSISLNSSHAPTDMSVGNAMSFCASRAASRSVRALCMIA